MASRRRPHIRCLECRRQVLANPDPRVGRICDDCAYPRYRLREVIAERVTPVESRESTQWLLRAHRTRLDGVSQNISSATRNLAKSH